MWELPATTVTHLSRNSEFQITETLVHQELGQRSIRVERDGECLLDATISIVDAQAHLNDHELYDYDPNEQSEFVVRLERVDPYEERQGGGTCLVSYLVERCAESESSLVFVFHPEDYDKLDSIYEFYERQGFHALVPENEERPLFGFTMKHDASS
jgi:hypothetical protein